MRALLGVTARRALRAPLGACSAIAVIGAVSAPVLAQSLQSQLEGTWKITAEYDQFTDGHKRAAYGNNPQGMAVYTPSGTFIFELMSGDRSGKPGTLPADPVGPAIAFFATYTVDDQNKTYTFHVHSAPFRNGTEPLALRLSRISPPLASRLWQRRSMTQQAVISNRTSNMNE
jgi:hypothetical protein